MRKIIAALAAAVLCLGLFAGCGYNPETVLTVNGSDIKAGKYLYLQFEAAIAAINAYGDVTVYDEQIFHKTIEGINAREWIANRTLERCKESVFIDQEFERLGLELDDYTEYYLDYEASSYWNSYGSMYTSNGIGYESFLEMWSQPYKKSLVIQTLYGEGGEYELTKAEKQKYFEQNYTRADIFEFPTTDANGYPLGDMALDKIGEVAELMSAAQNEEELYALYLEHYENVIAQTYSSEAIDQSTFNVLYGESSIISVPSYDAALVAEMLANHDGAYHHAEINGTHYVYRTTGLNGSDSLAVYDLEIVTNMGLEPFEALCDKATAEYTVEIDERAQEYYSLDNIVFSDYDSF